MELPIEVEIAFVDQIESAAQGWKDGIQSYEEFRKILDQMCLNIYMAGRHLTSSSTRPKGARPDSKGSRHVLPLGRYKS